LVWDQGVAGSNPVFPTMYGALAQLGELLPCTQEVSGSIPLGSTIYLIINMICSLKTEQNNQLCQETGNRFKEEAKRHIVFRNDMQTFMESLILAQDERWRRA